MEMFKTSLATLTGGSGAVAVLVTDGSFPADRGAGCSAARRRRPRSITACAAGASRACWQRRPSQIMSTDSVAILKFGVDLGLRTWKAFLTGSAGRRRSVDKVICHQVGSRPPRLHPQGAGHPAGKGILDLFVPRATSAPCRCR